jgi:hypothetical protein
MGEQFIDLFAAGAYGLTGRLLAALSDPSMSWLFELLAASGIAIAIMQSAVQGQSTLWLRHLAAVALASVLIAMPQRFDLAPLTYAAPGRVESVVGTRTGAAPHLTYAIERFGAALSEQLRRLLHNQPRLAVPSVAAQVAQLASDPGMLSDPQLKANLQAWREQVVPRLLQLQPALRDQLSQQGLLADLLNPAPPDARWSDASAMHRSTVVRIALAQSGVDLPQLAADIAPLQRDLADAAGAEPWTVDAAAASVRLRFASKPAPTPDPPIDGSPDYTDAVSRGTALSQQMLGALSPGPAIVPVHRLDELHEMLGRSLLYAAGASYLADDTRLATIGSLCQRLGDEACAAAQAPLARASQSLQVPTKDAYNSPGWTTLFRQPLATALLAVTSLLLDTLSSIVVAVLPFLLGVAKALAILMSVVGVWMLLWPGRLGEAIGWMVLPIAFVSLWSILFALWADVESFLSAIASTVGHADDGSLSAGRIMSIAISLGYLGLPAMAAAVLSGHAWRALDHASGHLEQALLTAWRTRHAMLMFSRRWLANSPLARRWNQRAYRAVGLGSLPRRPASSPRSRRRPPAGGSQGTPSAPATTAPQVPRAARASPGPSAARRPPAMPRRSTAPAPGQVKLDLGDPDPKRP